MGWTRSVGEEKSFCAGLLALLVNLLALLEEMPGGSHALFTDATECLERLEAAATPDVVEATHASLMRLLSAVLKDRLVHIPVHSFDDSILEEVSIAFFRSHSSPAGSANISR